MSDFSFNCCNCGQQLSIDQSGCGHEVQCTACGDAIVAPSASGGLATSATKVMHTLTPRNMLNIYLAKPGGQREGPFSLDQINRDLAAKNYGGNDYWAWYEGVKEWMPLYQVLDIFGGKSPDTHNYKRITPSEDYPSRLASLWHADKRGPLPPQLWIRFEKTWMAETVASLRPQSVEHYLANVPEVIADADGTGVAVFPLRDGAHIISVIKELIPVMSGEGCGGKKLGLSGGAAISLPPGRKSDLMFYIGGQAMEMGRVISW